MSLDNAIYAMSNINAMLSSTMSFVNNRQNGMPVGEAMADMGYNIMNGAMRNYVSREIRNTSGSYLGYMVNSMAGYGNPVANYQGTVGTMGAAMLTSPFGIFGGCMPTSYLYGCGPYGGGYFNSGFFGGGCCNSFYGPSMFGCRGFLC